MTTQYMEQGGGLREQHQAHLARRARLWRRPVERKPIHIPPPAVVVLPVVVAPPRPPKAPPFNFLKRPGPHAIVKLVSLKHKVSVADILGPSRSVPIAAARHEAVWLLRTHCGLSFPRIGRLFGGRDHSTAINSIRVYQQKLQGLSNAH